MFSSTLRPLLRPVELAEARPLCTRVQWAVIETSFSGTLQTLSLARLKSNILSVKNFRLNPGRRRKAQLFQEALDRFVGRENLLEQSVDLTGQAVIGDFEKEAPDRQTFHVHDIERRLDGALVKTLRSYLPAAMAAQSAQHRATAGAERVRSVTGAGNRRRQATRDMKNR